MTSAQPTASVSRILIADDQADVLESLRMLLKGEGYRIESAMSPAAVVEAVQREQFDVVLMDLNYSRDTTSGREGLDLLKVLQSVEPMPQLVVMTAWGSIELAVEAMQRGASDFVLKPWENDQLLEVIRKQLARARALREQKRIEDERQRAQQWESQEAKAVQNALLSQPLPNIPGFCTAVSWQPAAALAGDYYRVFPLPRAQFALCVADVAGKGVPAALVLSSLDSWIRAAFTQTARPADVCRRVNREMHGRMPAGLFITCFCAVLDPATRVLYYANAGHPAPLVIRKTGEIERLTGGGPVLGVFADGVYDQERVHLNAEDSLLAFSDGITEAASTDDEYGESRLIAAVSNHHALAPAECLDHLLRDVQAFAGRFQDDATLLLLRAN